MGDKFAKIRSKLQHIQRKNKERATPLVHRTPVANNLEHMSLAHMPDSHYDDNWARELRCRLLPWLTWRTWKTESWLETQMSYLAWKRASRFASPQTSQIYFTFTTEQACDWETLEIQCEMKGTDICPQQINLHGYAT